MNSMSKFGNSSNSQATNSNNDFESELKVATEGSLKENILYELFGDNSEIIGNYTCAIESGIKLQGRLYITKKSIYFYSNIFSLEFKLRIHLRHVKEIRKEGAIGFFTDSIYVTTGILCILFLTTT